MKIQSVLPQQQGIAPKKQLKQEQPKSETAGGTPADKAELGEAEEGDKKEWTILMYMNGNNGLSGQVVSNLRQLEYVGSDDKINLVAQASRAPGLLDRFSDDWVGTRRYKIEHNGKELTPGVIIGDFLTGWMPGKTNAIESPMLADLGADHDMGKADSLEDFVKWGMQNYPAKRYMVVMQGPSAGVSGMMHDQLHDSKMSPEELGDVFANVQTQTGNKVDVLTINGSATNSLEIAYELKDNVKYLVGSQGIQAGAGMPLGQIMNELKNVNEEQGQDALTMVRYWTLMNSMVGGALPGQSSTISAVDLDQMGAVKGAWDDLSKALLAADVGRDKLNELLDKTQDFQGTSKNVAYQNSRDAIHFAKLVLADPDITDKAVQQAAQNAIDKIDGALVGDAASGKYVAEANGLSVFAPTHYGFFRPESMSEANAEFTRDGGYAETQFAKDTQWDELLAAGAKDSWQNNALKKIGMSEDTVDTVHGLTKTGSGLIKAPLSFASLAGWSNAINAWRGAEATGFLFLSPESAVMAGVAGAGYDALQAIQGMHYAATELQDGDEVANKAFDLARAGAKAVANLGYMSETFRPYAGTAGMLMFMSPWIRNVYGIYGEYKAIRDGIELGTQTQTPLVQQWGQATMQHFQNDKLWDDTSL